MSWTKEGDAVTFSCDSCPETFFVDGDLARSGSSRPPRASLFTVCLDVARGAGWVSYKRVGRNWTYHCAGCAAQAAADHVEHIKRDAERERIKARNGE